MIQRQEMPVVCLHAVLTINFILENKFVCITLSHKDEKEILYPAVVLQAENYQ